MTERTALVVGASRGIGLGLAKELAGRGWTVIATRRSAASDKGLKAFADQSGGQVRVETLDLEDIQGIDAFASNLVGESLDLLMINAGISGPDTAASATRDGVASLFLTNAVAPLHLAEALLPRMHEGKGVIAFMSSGLGSTTISLRAGPDLYPASKAALNRLAMGFAKTLDGRELTVLILSPGWVRTDMGGPEAPLSVDQSARMVVDVIEGKAGSGEHGFYSHEGQVIPW